MNTSTKPKPTKSHLMTVTVERPRCPTCRSVNLRKYRSVKDQGDGSALSWVQCVCGQRFRVVLE